MSDSLEDYQTSAELAAAEQEDQQNEQEDQGQTAQPQQAQAAPATAPSQGVPTRAPAAQVSSERSPTARLKFDPRPLTMLKTHWPQMYDHVMQLSQVYHVDPMEIAGIGYIESRWNPNVPNSHTGAHGLMQLEPGFIKDYGKGLDPNNPFDNVEIGVRGLADLGHGKYQFGDGTGSQVVGYFAGPKNALSIAQNPDLAHHVNDGLSNAYQYVSRLQGGVAPTPDQFNMPGHADLHGLMQASEAGPDGFLRYVTETGPSNVGLSDKMRAAEGYFMGMALLRGNATEAHHVQDFFTQMSHAGANQHLMDANEALARGQTVLAMQHLAAAHAFFPDSTIGHFGVDSQGQIWAQQMDEHDPTKPLGQPFQVTQQGIEGMLNQTSDPRQYLQTLYAQREAAAKMRMETMHGAYYASGAQANEARAGYYAGRNQTTLEAAAIRAGGKAGQTKRNAAVDKEISNNFGDTSDLALGPGGGKPGMPREQRGVLGDLYYDLRTQGGLSEPSARVTAEGLAKGTLGTQADPSDPSRMMVVDKQGRTISYISAPLGQRLFGGASQTPQQANPSSLGLGVPVHPAQSIGAGAQTSYARGMGMGSNMAGPTTPNQPIPGQSAAIPPPGSNTVQ